jgi:hypothetical protein
MLREHFLALFPVIAEDIDYLISDCKVTYSTTYSCP